MQLFAAFILSLPATLPPTSGICLPVAELGSSCEVEMSAGGSHCPPEPSCLSPPSSALERSQSPGEIRRKGKKGSEGGRAALRGRWYSWYVISFSCS